MSLRILSRCGIVPVRAMVRFRCGRPMAAPAASQRLPRPWRSGQRPGRPVGTLLRPWEAARTQTGRERFVTLKSHRCGDVPMWASHGRPSRVPAAPASLAVGPEAGPTRGSLLRPWEAARTQTGRERFVTLKSHRCKHVPMLASHGRPSRVPASPASLAVRPQAGPARGTPAEAWRSREDKRDAPGTRPF